MMPTLMELLAMADNVKRRTRMQLADLLNNPDAAGEQTADHLRNKIPEWTSDPANFLPGGGLLGMTAKVSKPMTEAQFYRNYVQHLDIKGRTAGTQAENLAKIQEEGFKLGRAPNALPPARGGLPSNIIDKNFAPKSGDYVYLAPKEHWKNKPYGLEIQSGWKPAPHEVVIYRDEDVGKSAYQMFIENMRNRGLLDE